MLLATRSWARRPKVTGGVGLCNVNVEEWRRLDKRPSPESTLFVFFDLLVWFGQILVSYTWVWFVRIFVAFVGLSQRLSLRASFVFPALLKHIQK